MDPVEIEIAETIENGNLNDLLNLRREVESEVTNNKRYLSKLDNAIKRYVEND